MFYLISESYVDKYVTHGGNINKYNIEKVFFGVFFNVIILPIPLLCAHSLHYIMNLFLLYLSRQCNWLIWAFKEGTLVCCTFRFITK